MASKTGIEDALRELARLGYLDTHEFEDLQGEVEELRTIARTVAGMEPIYAHGWSETRYCFFCDRDNDYREGHEDGCVWVQARALTADAE